MNAMFLKRSRARIFQAVAATGLCLMAMSAVAAPSVGLQPASLPEAGPLADGTLLARGWVDASSGDIALTIPTVSGDKTSVPGHYVIRGALHPQNRLRIRLGVDAEGLKNDALGDVVVPASREPVRLTIVVDGEQTVMADRYLLTLTATQAQQNE